MYMQDQHSPRASAAQNLSAGQTEPAGFNRGACGSSYFILVAALPAWPCFHPTVQLQAPHKHVSCLRAEIMDRAFSM